MGGSAHPYPSLHPKSDLRTHINYEHTEPVYAETLVAYALRCAAHLVSPPMLPDEDNEFECQDVAAQILLLEKEITEKWDRRRHKKMWRK